MPAVLKNHKPVTAERLKSPSDEDWLMIRRTYDGWGFSPLSDITPANAAPATRVGVFDRRGTRASGRAAREQRCDVRDQPEQPGHRDRRQDRNSALALSTAPRNGHERAAPDQSRRRALWRQGLLRRGRGGARCPRCEDGTRGLDLGRCGQQGRLLHDARTAGRWRCGDGWRFRR